MVVDFRVVRFQDRRGAYGFVAELRRLYDLERCAGLWVHATSDGTLVEIPRDTWTAVPLLALVTRYGGWAPAGDDLERLRVAVHSARKSLRSRPLESRPLE
jgi:hypothetical protein